MTEWLLILTLQIINMNGLSNAITTVKVPDKKSCVRAGEYHKHIYKSGGYECIEITKETK